MQPHRVLIPHSLYTPIVRAPVAPSIILSSILNTCFFFFFNDTATTEIYTLSLHDALPIWVGAGLWQIHEGGNHEGLHTVTDRKSTRLNSSHLVISYAVFCLKKKKITK